MTHASSCPFKARQYFGQGAFKHQTNVKNQPWWQDTLLCLLMSPQTTNDLQLLTTKYNLLLCKKAKLCGIEYILLSIWLKVWTKQSLYISQVSSLLVQFLASSSSSILVLSQLGVLKTFCLKSQHFSLTNTFYPLFYICMLLLSISFLCMENNTVNVTLTYHSLLVS